MTTFTYTSLAEAANQFIYDHHLTPRYVGLSLSNGPYVFIQVDGDGDTADLISESLYWERDELGFTAAHQIVDGIRINVTIYEDIE